ncbi:MAG: hypothetical protein P8Y42_19010 [Exilibacterium sp.]
MSASMFALKFGSAIGGALPGFILFYKIDRKTLIRIEAELNARRGAVSSLKKIAHGCILELIKYFRRCAARLQTCELHSTL